MSTRSAATFTTGDVISQTVLRNIRDNGDSQETGSDPAGLSEGMRWTRTDQDRGWLYNGSATVYQSHYSASGRPWAKAAIASGTLSTPGYSTVVHIPWTASDDPDSACTSSNTWDGTRYKAFIAPRTGVYDISWFAEFTTQNASNDKQWWILMSASTGFKSFGHGQGKAGVWGNGTVTAVPLATSDYIYFTGYYEDSTTRTIAGTSYLTVALKYV